MGQGHHVNDLTFSLEKCHLSEGFAISRGPVVRLAGSSDNHTLQATDLCRRSCGDSLYWTLVRFSDKFCLDY